jgi:PAS domain S-box-containing protein
VTASNKSAETAAALDAGSPSPSTALAWQLVLRRLPAIVWTTDRKLRITSAGGAAFGELSLHSNSLIGRLVADCFESVSGAATSVVAAHQTALAGEATTVECVWNRKVFRLYLEPMTSAGGKLEGCVGMAVDITPRKQTEELLLSGEAATHSESPQHSPLKVRHRLQTEVEDRRAAEAALRESHERFLQLAASIDSAFWIYDLTKERIIYLSPGYEKIWGIPADEALQASKHAIWGHVDDDYAEQRDTLDQWQRDGEPFVDEFRIRRPDGSLCWIRARTFPIHGSGRRVERMAGVAEDITRRKNEEEQKRRNERLATLGGFTAGIAHEVNNPLGAALSSTQAALRLLPQRSSPLLKECLENTLESVRRSTAVVRSLLRFCRDEPAHRCEFDLCEVARIAVTITHTYAAAHACQLQLELGDAPQNVLGIPIELEMVFVNLVRNAIEAGASRITLSAQSDGHQVVFQVADNGCGIAEGDAWRLCDPFFTTRRKSGGTGLGLSIVHKIIQEHGGTLTFSPQAPRGTLVCVALPQVSNEE